MHPRGVFRVNAIDIKREVEGVSFIYFEVVKSFIHNLSYSFFRDCGHVIVFQIMLFQHVPFFGVDLPQSNPDNVLQREFDSVDPLEIRVFLALVK